MTTPSRPPVVPLRLSPAVAAAPGRAQGSNTHAASNDASARKADAPLFRLEVLEAQGTRALGNVLIAQPFSTLALTLVAVALALGLLGFGYWGQYTRKTHVSGYLVPTAGEVKVFSREVGTILESRVAEGQKVAKGDVLYVVSLERQSSDGVETQAVAISELRQRRSSLESDLQGQRSLVDVERRSLTQRVTAMEGERSRLSSEIDVQTQRLATTEKNLERYRDLQAKGLTSAELVDQKTNDVFDQQGRLHELERSRIGMSRDIEVLRGQIKSLQIKAATDRSAIGRGVSQLDQELAEYGTRRTFVVTAPAPGTATAVLARVGQTANTTQPLVSILPENAELSAHLVIPSAAIGFLAVNQTVSLRYRAFPYQRFGSYRAHIAEISKTLIMPREADLPIPLQEPAYRVTVALDQQFVNAYGQALSLQAGMLVDADIWLDRRRLYEWVLEPLYSVLGKV